MFVTDLEKFNEAGPTSHRQNNNIIRSNGFNPKLERPSTATSFKDYGLKTASLNNRK